jgi:hypothetical protein
MINSLNNAKRGGTECWDLFWTSRFGEVTFSFSDLIFTRHISVARN